MKTLILFVALFKKSWAGFRRYIFETISGIVTLFLFFLALFFGLKTLAAGAPGLGGTLDAIVVGYIVWTLAIFTYFSLAQSLIQEAQLGTLEQVAMSPFGLSKVVLAEVAAGLVFQFLMMAVLLTSMMAVTGKWLHMDLLSIIPIALMTVGGVVGLSLVMGGLAVVFKRVQSALQIMQMVFIALVAIPVSHFTWIKYMPLAWGNAMLRRVMVDGDSLLTIPARDSLFLFAHMIAYLVAGTIVFKYFERIARARGLLGHY